MQGRAPNRRPPPAVPRPMDGGQQSLSPPIAVALPSTSAQFLDIPLDQVLGKTGSNVQSGHPGGPSREKAPMGWSAVIVAAGASSRAGEGPRKPWRRLGGRAVVAWSLDAFKAAGAARIVLVVSKDDQPLAEALVGLSPNCTVVAGGETRAESVR